MEKYEELKKYFLNKLLTDDIKQIEFYFKKNKTKVNVIINENNSKIIKFTIEYLTLWDIIINNVFVDYPKIVKFNCRIDESFINMENYIDNDILEDCALYLNKKYWYDKEESFVKSIICDEIYKFMSHNVNKIETQSFFSNDKTKYQADFYYAYKDENDFLVKIKTNLEHTLYCLCTIMKYNMDMDYQNKYISKCFNPNLYETIYRFRNYNVIIGFKWNESLSYRQPYLKSFQKIN